MNEIRDPAVFSLLLAHGQFAWRAIGDRRFACRT